jgi:hypothetical protein
MRFQERMIHFRRAYADSATMIRIFVLAFMNRRNPLFAMKIRVAQMSSAIHSVPFAALKNSACS